MHLKKVTLTEEQESWMLGAADVFSTGNPEKPDDILPPVYCINHLYHIPSGEKQTYFVVRLEDLLSDCVIGVKQQIESRKPKIITFDKKIETE